MTCSGVVTICKEPLVHFLLIGGMLFGVYAWLNRGTADAPRVVHITAADVNWLQVTWSRQRQRPPNQQELRGLVNDYLKEVLLAREAKEMGLDQDDTIVRRRLAQKMEFLVEDTTRLAEPDETELRQYYDRHPSLYQIPERISFSQIFFKTEVGARRALQALAKHDSDDVGDPNLLGREFEQTNAQIVQSVFGQKFATAIFAMQPERTWQGPIASAYGFHLVRLTDRQAAQVRPFEAVHAQVLDEWRRTEQTNASKQYYAKLLQKYDVVVDQDIKSLVGSVGSL